MQVTFTVDTVTKDAKVTVDGTEYSVNSFSFNKYECEDKCYINFSEPEKELADESEIYVSYRVCGSEIERKENKNIRKTVATFFNDIFSNKK